MGKPHPTPELIYQLSTGEDARDVAQEKFNEIRPLGLLEKLGRKVMGMPGPRPFEEVKKEIEQRYPDRADQLKILDTLSDIRAEQDPGFSERKMSKMARSLRRDDRYVTAKASETETTYMTDYATRRAQDIVSEEAMERYHKEQAQGHTEWRKRFESVPDAEPGEGAEKKDEGRLLH